MWVGRGCEARAMEVWEECGLAGFPTAPGVQTDPQKYVKCLEEDVASYGHRTRLVAMARRIAIGHVLSP